MKLNCIRGYIYIKQFNTFSNINEEFNQLSADTT